MHPLTNPFATILRPLTRATSTSPYTPLVSAGDNVTMSVTGIFPYGVLGTYSPASTSASTSTAAELNLYIPNNSLYSSGLTLSQDGKRYANSNEDKVLSVGGEVEVKVLLIREGGEVGLFHAVCGVVSAAGGREGMLKRGVRMETCGDGDWELGMVGL